jgi:hypothetical protein
MGAGQLHQQLAVALLCALEHTTIVQAAVDRLEEAQHVGSTAQVYMHETVGT